MNSPTASSRSRLRPARRGALSGILACAICFAGCILPPFPTPGHAAPPAAVETRTLLEEASQLFAEAHKVSLSDPAAARQLYRMAARRFSELTTGRGITNPQLLTNEGNAALLAGDLGAAIFAYRRARTLGGASRDVDRALEHAREQVTGVVDPLPGTPLQRIGRAVTAAPRVLWSILLLLGWPLLFLVLYRALTRPVHRRMPGLLLCCGLGATCLVAFLLSARQDRQQAFGVVVAESVIARTGDASVYAAAFSSPLPPGIEFEPLRQRRGWIEARFSDGTTAWIEQHAAMLWPAAH